MVEENSNLQAVICKETKEVRQEGRREGSRKTHSVFLDQHACALMHKKESLHFLTRILLDINILGAAIVHRNIQQDILLVSFIICN